MAIKFNIKNYKETHGHSPWGKHTWGFEIKPEDNQGQGIQMESPPLNFLPAKQWAVGYLLVNYPHFLERKGDIEIHVMTRILPHRDFD